MTTPEPAWIPPLDGSTNIEKFMRQQGVASFAELVDRSVNDPEWFWDEIVDFLDIPFSTPYTTVLDRSAGAAWCRWFDGGRTNAAEVCLDRWANDLPVSTKAALVWEAEDGRTTTWTYAQLRAQTDVMATELRSRGIGEGDVVGLYLPMIPETIATFLAAAKIGAISLLLFSGYGADAISTRLQDAGARALVTVESTRRRGVDIPMEEIAAHACAAAPTVQHLVVIQTAGSTVDEAQIASVDSVPVASEAPLLLAYTSGTTGKPKGAVHVHGGFTAKIAQEGAFQFDIRREDRLFWIADFGWIMGPWQVIAVLSRGATLCIYDGVPDYPDPGGMWGFVERNQVSILGASPTLIRTLMARGDEMVAVRDLSRLRVLGSTGELWNRGPWWWYFDVVGGRRCPIINISGGSEVGACFLSPHPVTPIAPMSLGGPALGMAVDIFDDEGRSVAGSEVGELVCTRPWPGMTRGLWGNPQRFLDTYWSRWPGVWVQGDWASVADDGQWFLHGRSDDTLNISGKRLGPAEVESALVAHESVAEAAAVGIPDERTGEQLWVFVVLADSHRASHQLADELTQDVARRLGASFRPRAVRFTDALPKTKTAKVLRRMIRSIALDEDPGDLSSLDDPAALTAIEVSLSASAAGTTIYPSPTTRAPSHVEEP